MSGGRLHAMGSLPSYLASLHGVQPAQVLHILNPEQRAAVHAVRLRSRSITTRTGAGPRVSLQLPGYSLVPGTTHHITSKHHT